MELLLAPGTQSSFELDAVRAVARLAGMGPEDLVEVQLEEAGQPGLLYPQLRCGPGLTLSGSLTISTFLALRSDDPQLSALARGADVAEEMKVKEYALFALTELAGAPLSANKHNLFYLNSQLATRLQLVGAKHPTLADLFVWCALRNPLLQAAAAGQLVDLAPLCHLVRWFDYVQASPLGAAVRGGEATEAEFLGPLLETPFEADRATCIEIANWEAQHRAQQQAKSGGGGSASGASGPSSGGKKGAPAAAGGKKGAPAAGGGKKGAPASAATPGEGSSSDGGAQAQRGKREKKEKPKKEKPPAPADDISAFDIRVGVVLTAKKHPGADKLFLETIDVGEEAPRQIVSGLADFVSLEEFIGSHVCVLCNLRPSKIRGEDSFGMVMCASTSDKSAVQPLAPPKECNPGDRITVDGCDGQPDKVLSTKKMQRILQITKTSADGVAQHNNIDWRTPHGQVRSSLPDATIA